jgi:hypothetical protein
MAFRYTQPFWAGASLLMTDKNRNSSERICQALQLQDCSRMRDRRGGTRRTVLLSQWISAEGPLLTLSRQLLINVRFANRPVGVKRIQAIHDSDGDVARGFVLLCGIGAASVSIALALRRAKEVIE